MFSELTVIVKDEEKTLRKKFPIYESYEVSENDVTIRKCIHETLENFDTEPSRVTVKITLDIS